MKMKRLTAVLLVIIIAIMCVTSCANRGETALEYKGVRVDEQMYSYFMSHYKSVFLASFSGASDTDAFWETVREDGMTNEEYFNAVALENVKKYVAATWMFSYMDRKFTSAMKKEIDAGLDEVVENAFGGDEGEFKSHLSSLGISRDVVYDVYVMDAKSDYMYEYLYGFTGVIDVPDSDRLSYMLDNYSHIEHIYVNNVYKYATDEDGEYIYDDYGYSVTVDLSEEELAEANGKIEAIKNGLSAGEDFHMLWLEYSDDHLYSDGYYLKPTTRYIPEIVKAAFELEIGEVYSFEADNGVHFIKRLEIEGKPWDNNANDDFLDGFEDELRAYLYSVMIGEYTADIVVNEDIIGKYSIRNAKQSPYV